MELEELKNIFKELGLINEKQEKRVCFHEMKAQYLTIAYVICQALIFNAITHQSSSSSHQCQNWWVPFTISLSCSLIYFMAFLDAVSMFYRTQYQLDLNYAEQQIIHLQIYEAKSHKLRIGKLEVSNKQRAQAQREMLLKPDEVQLLKRKVYISVTITGLIAFAVLMLFACRSYLCH